MITDELTSVIISRDLGSLTVIPCNNAEISEIKNKNKHVKFRISNNSYLSHLHVFLAITQLIIFLFFW